MAPIMPAKWALWAAERALWAAERALSLGQIMRVTDLHVGQSLRDPRAACTRTTIMFGGPDPPLFKKLYRALIHTPGNCALTKFVRSCTSTV